MNRLQVGALVAILAIAVVVGCSGRDTQGPPSVAKEESARKATAPVTSDAVEPAATKTETSPTVETKATSGGAPPATRSEEPSPRPGDEEPAAEAPARADAPAPAIPAKPVPAGRIEVGATKAGLTRIGADKCKLCHKTQYESWAATAHASADPPLDCESCHGPGSEYKAMAIMKDPAKARAAGLVLPEAAFCTSSCHDTGWSAEMLAKAHAHKKT